MKKQFKISVLMALFILAVCSCSTIKKLPANVAGASRARFVGTWTITNISYDGLLPGSVQSIFNQASPDAFKSSVWNLTNSGNGIYTLIDGSSQTIFWSFNKSNGEIFQFKKLYQGDSAGKIQSGYQLIVASIDDNNMVLRLPVVFGGKTAYIILSFYKSK
jgi:hypothetical protein